MDPSLRAIKSQSREKNGKQEDIFRFRLPTKLLSNSNKEEVFLKLREKLGKQMGNFHLSTSHGLDAGSVFENVEAYLSSDKPLLMILKINTHDGKRVTIGIFYKSDKKKGTNAIVFPLNWNNNCLLFKIIDNEPIQFEDISKQVGTHFVEYRTEN